MRVAVGDDVEAGHFLLVQIEANRVDILLAELVVHHRVEETALPRFCVYQLGRGSEPVMVVGSMMSLVARNIVDPPKNVGEPLAARHLGPY